MNMLVPVDFSAPSQEAFKFAVAMATVSKATIDVVYMITTPLLQETAFGIQPPLFDSDLTAAVAEKASHAFATMRDRYAPDIAVRFAFRRQHLVSGLLDAINDCQSDLVVMSMHGAETLGDPVVGSKVEKFSRLAPVPVLFLAGSPDFSAVKNIVFANMLDHFDDELMTHVKELQRIFDAKLHVLVVNTPANFLNDEQAHARLENFARRYELKNFTLNVRNHQFERSAILHFVNEVHGDMVAMATHGRKGLNYFVNGSIAESVLHRIDKPIWIWKRAE